MDNSIQTKSESGLMTADSFKEAFGDYTGSDYSRGGASYPNLIILQSDKTLDNFIDGNEIAKKEYGKIFIRSSNKNSSKDLLERVSGIIIKEQKGAELWKDNKCLYTAGHFLSAEMKQEVAQEHGADVSDVKNIIKLLIKLDEPIKLFNNEEYTFVVLTIKGAGFMNYNKAVKETQQEIFLQSEQFKALKIANVSRVPVVFWRLEIFSKVEKNDAGQTYYVFDFKVSEVPSNEAFELKDVMVESGKFDLITMAPVGTSVGNPMEVDLDKVNAKPAETVMAEDGDVADTSIDPNDLPF